MLGVGAVLTVVSLWQASERFWHWKRARQIHQGEIVPAASALRSGQALAFAASATLSNSQTGNYAAKILSLKRNALLFSVDSSDAAAYLETDVTLPVPEVGETLLLQVTGTDALYRFTTQARTVHSDLEMSGRYLISVTVPFWVTSVQRREHVRAAVQVGVTLRLDPRPAGIQAVSWSAETMAARTQMEETMSAGTGSVEMLRGQLLDLSGGGLRLELAGGYSPHTVARLYEKLSVGAPVEIELDLPLLRSMPLRLNIRSCQRVAARGGLGLCLRGAFAAMPAMQQDTVISYVFQAQRDQLQQTLCSS